MINQVMKRPMFTQQGSSMGGEQAFMQYLQTTLSPEQLQSLMQDPNRDQIIGQLYQKFISEQQVQSSPIAMRQTGSPEIGERVSDLQSLLADIRANEGMRDVIGNEEADNVSRQLGNLMRVPFEEFSGMYVTNPQSGEIEPMSGPLKGSPSIEEVISDKPRGNMGQFRINSTGETVILEMTPELQERVRSGELDFIKQLPTRAPMDDPSTLDTILNLINRGGNAVIDKFSDVLTEPRPTGNPRLNPTRAEPNDPSTLDTILNLINRGGQSLIDKFSDVLTEPRPTGNPRFRYYFDKDGKPQVDIREQAEGGEMKSDAVGIADGLDQEEQMSVDRDPSNEGIAKVSPEQYVELMNEVRGDEVPMEGRVQELASVVGEKDATDTPLSVLALVQPIFEMKEQQGIAQTQQGQQMMTQGPIPMAAQGGIVHLANGPGEDGVYSGMVGPLSLDQIQNFGLYTRPEMSDLGVASYTAGAGDVLASGSPEAILTQLSGMATEPQTFAEILADKKASIGKLGLYDSQKEALKIPFLSGVTKFGLDVARGDNVVESALDRFNEATSTALPMALKIKSQEKQLPLQLALSEYSSQKADAKEMKKFVLGKSFDLALENQKNQGVGTVGVVGTNNEVIDSTFGSGVSESLPVGTIVQKNTSGVMSVIKPDKFKAENLITVTGTYVTNKLDQDGRPIVKEINTVIDLSTESGKAEFDTLKEASQLKASKLIFKSFLDTQSTNIIQMPDPILNEAQGGEIVKRDKGTEDNPIGGEVATNDELIDIMSDEAFADLEIDPFAAGPGRIDITKLDGSNRILGLRHNTGYETLAAIEDLVLRSYTQPQTIGALSSVLRGYANVSNTVDELLTQLIGKGLPESVVYNNPELQKSLEDMMKIPKLIAEVEAGASRYRATSKDIDKIAKERLDYGLASSSSSIRKSLMAAHKTIFDKMNTYRDSLGQGTLKYETPEIFNEEYGATLAPKDPIKLPSKEDFSAENLQSTLLDALPNIDLKKYPQLLTDPIFTGAIYSISQGATVEDVTPKFLELFNEKYGTGE